jgi:hypothetical protein
MSSTMWLRMPMICRSMRPIRTMPTARSAKRPDPQPRTATEPILLPRQSGRRMACEQGSDQEETIP